MLVHARCRRRYCAADPICNQDRHGKAYKAQADVAHRQAVTELMALYELKDSVEPHLQWIFDTATQTYLLSQSISRKLWAHHSPQQSY